MRKRIVAGLLAGVALLMVMAALPAMADKPVTDNCPRGYDHGPWTFEEGLAHKESINGGELPQYSMDAYSAIFAATDKNGDGRVCFKDLPDTPGIPSYVTQHADNVSKAH